MPFSFVSAGILATNGLLLFISVYWTASSWDAVRDLESRPEWLRRNCTVGSSSLSHHRDHFRNEFTVTGFNLSSDSPAKPPTTAFRYGTPIYNQTLASARAFQEARPVNGTYACWLDPPPNGTTGVWSYSVAMQRPHAGATQGERDMAILSTVFAIVTCFTLVLQFACFALAVHDPAFLQPIMPAQPPSASARATLSRERIDALCARVEPPDGDELMRKGSVCAICLEDEGGALARLPCEHVFHAECVRRWLMRGGTACPLCNMHLGESEAEAPEEGAPSAEDAAARQVSRSTSRSVSIVSGVGELVSNASWRRLVSNNSARSPPEPTRALSKGVGETAAEREGSEGNEGVVCACSGRRDSGDPENADGGGERRELGLRRRRSGAADGANSSGEANS